MTKKKICALENCNKRLNVVDCLSSTCKCKKVYCAIHRLPETHDCCYDFMKEVNQKMEIDKLRCVSTYDKI